jgi:hypothetical protein
MIVNSFGVTLALHGSNLLVVYETRLVRGYSPGRHKCFCGDITGLAAQIRR